MTSVELRVARGGSGAPPLAARPKLLEALFTRILLDLSTLCSINFLTRLAHEMEPFSLLLTRRISSPRKREGNVRFPTNLHGVVDPGGQGLGERQRRTA